MLLDYNVQTSQKKQQQQKSMQSLHSTLHTLHSHQPLKSQGYLPEMMISIVSFAW